MQTVHHAIYLTQGDFLRAVSNVGTINSELGGYAALFSLLATVVYVVAFLFFAWDLVTAYKSTTSYQKEEMIQELQSELDEELEEEKSEEKELALALGNASFESQEGASGFKSSSGSGLKGPEDRVITRTQTELNSLETADSTMNYSSESNKTRPWARIAVALTIVGFAISLIAVICRGVAANRVPWGNMYEYCTTGALLVVLVFLVILIKKDIRFVGTFVVALVVVMMVAATIGFYVPVGHLVPALNSYWIVIHVSIAILASGIFTITFVMAVLQLLQTHRMKKIDAGNKDPMPFLRIVPSAKTLEDAAYRLNAFAFILWTITVVFGAIWAEAAWGRYWGWDPKEVWSFVIWIVYAVYLHARATKGWSGTPSAWLSIIGYMCVLFNFTVVNIFFSGLHSYSGL